ncbi:DUF3327 domain-containing protein [Nakamurella sp. YIM 132087]|uniref:DUF3327 domain-containing protein n=1 Tax=Nakamurella alba TaxID=2665158 RepID=A0A7K1FLG1_9ACTN|nr:enterochelin esterase domain-containing protein [Nakamurella alba]MTD14900.1 DUF3327 domain-containing protein [Nakamurella alba]
MTAAALRPPKVPRPTPAPRTSDPALRRLAGRLLAAAPAEQARIVAEFWSGVGRSGAPMITPTATPGRYLVTFLWRDPMTCGVPLPDVLLFVNRLTDERDLARSLMSRIAGTDIWHLTYEVSSRWRAGYAFLPLDAERSLLAEGDQVRLRSALDAGRTDPFGSDTVWARGGGLRSVVSLPEAPPEPWRHLRPAVPAGRLDLRTSPDLPGYPGRRVWVHRPAGIPDGAPLPVLVLLDGDVWAQHVPFLPSLANLMADGMIPPMVTVLPDSGSRDRRWTELTDQRPVVDAIVDHLVPWATGGDGHLGITVAGASLGGLTAVAAALLRPDRVTGAAGLSSSLWWNPAGDPVPPAHRWALDCAPGPRLDLQVGLQEWVLLPPHHEFTDVLRSAGHDVTLTEFDGGHDHACWRGGLADALVRLHDAERAAA